MKHMTTTQAFQNFIDEKLYSSEVMDKYSKGTQAAWKNRFKNNALSSGIMEEKLHEFGYVRTEEQGEVRWLLPETKKQYNDLVRNLKDQETIAVMVHTTSHVQTVNELQFKELCQITGTKPEDGENLLLIKNKEQGVIVIIKTS